MDRKIIIGTRGSDLALWQANFVKSELARLAIPADIKIIKTQGDKIQNLRLDKLEGKGFFTKELEEELLNGSIDIAVHSHKDLPTQHPAGLIIAAVSEREDPSELLIIQKAATDSTQRLSLKHGALVGTSSNRRKAQLLALRPDLQVNDLRGNVPTRIQKLRDKHYDAIIIARAGVERLGIDLSDFTLEILNPTEFIPAPAQGVLGIQIRETDHELYNKLQALNHADVAAAIGVERSVLNLFEGGCHMPLGCYCRKEGNKYQVWTSKAQDADHFPDRLFMESESLDGLAGRIVNSFAANRPLARKVFISRDLSEQSYFKRAMESRGIQVEGRSLIHIKALKPSLDEDDLQDTDWVFFNSRNAVECFFALKPRLAPHTRFAALGRGTEETLRSYGKMPAFSGGNLGIDTRKAGEAFAPLAAGQRVLFPCAKGSLKTVQNTLNSIATVINLPVYQTIPSHEVNPSAAEVLIFTSPSNAEAYFHTNALQAGQQILSIGLSTGRKLSEMGLQYSLPYSSDEIGLAEAVFGLNT